MPLILQGDCLQILPTLPLFKFAFADPPFNIGVEYAGYKDNLPAIDYFNWTMDWIKLLWERIDPNGGVMCLHGPDNLTDMYTIAAARLGMYRIARIVWHYRFAVNHRGNWPQAHCYCSVYARGNYTWNPDAVLVESDRASVYNDKRVHDTDRGGSRLPGTVWGIPSDGQYWGRVTGTSAERRPLHENQLPEVYLKRLLLAYTNPGDMVLDPFGGSGTTITVATALSRHCTTIELSPEYCESISERLEKGMVRV